MDTRPRSERIPLRLLLIGLLLGTAVSHAQQPRNFLQNILGTKPVHEQPLLSAVAPRFGFNVASRAVKPAGPADGGIIPLEVDGIPVKLQLQYDRQQGIDLYRIRHAPDSPLRGEQVRVSWSFSQGFNESMSVDAGALQGQPLFLPNGKVPDNHFTNWGTLFYHREVNVAVGTHLQGAEPSRHARRGHSRFRRTLLHFLNSAQALTAGKAVARPSLVGPSQMGWDEPVRIAAVRYELPAFINFHDRDWHRGPASYAHYVVEGSKDAERSLSWPTAATDPGAACRRTSFNPRKFAIFVGAACSRTAGGSKSATSRCSSLTKTEAQKDPGGLRSAKSFWPEVLRNAILRERE